MPVFALVENGIVTQTNVSDQAYIDTLPNANQWYLTDLNTRGGIHYSPDGQPDGGIAFRANYAIIDGTYDFVNDVFYGIQPFSSWTISAPTWTWQAPIPYPQDSKDYYWDETTSSWIIVDI